MKFLLIGLVFLVMGCQTIASENIAPAVKEEPAEPAEVVEDPSIEEKQSKIPNKSDKNIDPSFLSTKKPIVCGDARSIMVHLSDIGEVPIASWYDVTGNFPVLFLVNMKSGTSSVLEFPGRAFPNTKFKNLACFVSIGLKTVLEVPKKEEKETKVQFISKR